MKNKIIYLILFIMVFVFAILIFKYANSNNKNSNIVEASESQLSNINFPNTKLPPTLKNNPTKVPVYAKNYILLDNETFYPLTEKESNNPVPIASTTKIMTAIIALENYKLDDIVIVSRNAASQIGSEVYLRTDEKITVQNLLYALLIQSGNDAAMALAENMGKDQFVQKMNEKAKYLGMDNTEYKDPAGLDDAGHSSAKDLAIAFSYALKFDEFKKIIKTQEITIASIDGKSSHNLKNSNRLIKPNEKLFYSESLGGKTGYTPEAGHCLVSAAQDNNHLVVSVVLNTNSTSVEASAYETKKLIEWGFANYIWQ